MTLLKQVNENEATDAVKQVYDGFSQILGKVPNVVKFHTASSTIYPYFMGLVNEFADHPRLDPILLTYLRIMVSNKYGGAYCVKFQSFLAKARGESDENISAAINKPETIDLDEKRKTLLLFALDVVDGKHDNIENRIAALKSIGWCEQDIYEICFLGGLQKGMVPLVTGFKVEHDF